MGPQYGMWGLRKYGTTLVNVDALVFWPDRLTCLADLIKTEQERAHKLAVPSAFVTFRSAVLCCAMLCYAVSCCVLCHALPCCAVLSCAVLCHAVLCCMLCHALPCYAVLYHAVLSCLVLCCAVPHRVVLC